MKRDTFLLIFGGAWLVVAVPFVLFGRHTLALDARYSSEGAEATGTVTSRRIEERWNSKERRNEVYYHVAYSFLAGNGRTIDEETSVAQDEYDTLTEGSEVAVQYLPDDPEQNRLAVNSFGDALGGYLMLAFGGISLLIGGTSVGLVMRSRLRTRRLLASGIPAEGEIVAVEPTGFSINNEVQWRLRYVFTDLQGRRCTGVSATMPPADAHLWNEGDRGKVRYDRNDPSRSIWTGADGV